MPIYLVLVLAFFNETSLRAANVILVLYAVKLGAQPLTIGVLAATFSVFPMLFAVPAGKLADRFGARWLLTFGGSVGVLGMLIPYFAPGLPAVFMAAAMFGLLDGIQVVSLQSLVGILSNPHDRAKSFSNYSVATSVATFVGPLIAGFSIDHSGHVTACLYIALFASAPVAILLMWGGAIPAGVRQVARGASSTRDMLSAPGVRKVLATGSLFQTGNTLYQFYMPVYAYSIGLSASTIGIVLAMNSAAMFVVRLALPRLIARFKEGKILAYMFHVGAASLILIPFFENAEMLALLSFIFGLGMGCGGPIINVLMFSNAPQGRFAEALGLKMTVNHLTKMISPVVFGAIGSTFGLFPVFWINALLMGAGGLLSRDKRPQ